MTTNIPDSFVRLRDVPRAYSGQAGKNVSVNSSENGLEFTDPPTGGLTAVVADSPLSGAGTSASHLVVDLSSKQTHSVNLDAWSALATSAKQDALGFTPVPNTRTVNGHALSSDVTVTPSDLSLVIGTNVEAWSANLDAWSALATSAKVSSNGAITGATKTKITFDTKGLVTSGADATTADIADSTNKRYVTDANLTVIGNTSGTNTGDQTLVGLGGVPTSRTLTIAGTALDLSTDRSWTVALSALSDASISSPTADDILRYNGASWVNTPFVTPVNAGAGVNFFYDDTSSDISGYQTLNRGPENVSESTLTGVANNGRTLIKAYASASAGLGGSQIDSGEWIFDVYAKVDVISLGLSSVDIDVLKRTSGGTETLLFNVNTGALSTSTQLYDIASIQQAFAINSTDRLVIKVYAKTTAVVNRTVTFYYGGTTHYSNVSTPLVIRHNDLTGLQGGTAGQEYHLTSAEYTGTGSGTFVRTSSPAITTPTGIVKGDVGLGAVTNDAQTKAAIVPNSVPTAGQILIGNAGGTAYVPSTPTYPNASATLNNIIKSDGTNFVASSETYAAPGTSGNVMTSDGTNWTSAAQVAAALNPNLQLL
jgi:hypothetical protein